MSLDAKIIEPVTGQIDPELEAHIDADTHGLLFAHPEIRRERFPLLSRITDYYADAEYTVGEIEPLIAELEQAGPMFGADTSVRHFIAPFHLMCCLAFIRRKGVALYAD